jgi:hypothetical protein
VLVRDPRSEPRPRLDAKNLVVWWPDHAGYDVPMPARIDNDGDYPFLDVAIRESEFVGSVPYGTGDRQWTWPNEPVRETSG